MLLVGLTGGVASGKTLVSDRFAELGVPIVDADIISREIVAPGSAGLAELVAVFGDELLSATGELDRAALRERAFSDDAERQKLNAILHPRIREQSARRLAEHREAGARYAIYAVPLLVETDQQNRFNRILVVDVPESVQIERLVARDGGDASAARRVLEAQASRQQRLAVATDVIVNTGSIKDTIAEVNRLHTEFLLHASELG